MWLKAGKQERFDDRFHSIKEKEIISKSSVMKALLKETLVISKNTSPTLIMGGYGTGRSMMGRKIFNQSHTNNGDLIVINCAGMSASQIEEDLFSSSKNVLKNIYGKTLMLESIDCLPDKLQPRLLNFLRNSQDSKQNYKFRLIATASERLYQKIEKGEFRENLFSYLSQNLLITPLLAERTEDIPDLIDAFFRKNNFKGTISEEAIQALVNHNWKGNVIELKNICNQISTLHKDKVITRKELSIVSHEETKVHLFVKYNPKIKLDELVNYYITQSLKHFNSKKASADSLGISVKTIYNKLESGVVKT